MAEETKKNNIILRVLKHPIFINFLIMIGIVFVLIFIALYCLKVYTKHDESIIVPSVKGYQVKDAAGLLRTRDLAYEVIDSSYTSSGVPGAIIEQKPSENSRVKKGRIVYLVIKAKGIQMVSIPSLKDYSQRQALAHLNALGFSNVVVSEVSSQYKGLVLKIEYKGKEIEAGEKIPKGATLRMIVGAGGGTSDEETADTTTTADVDQSFFE